MPLDGTYTGLQASIADWLNRGDLTAQIPDFIALVETKLNRTIRLRIQEVAAPLTTVAGSRFMSLPPLFNEALKLSRIWPWGEQELHFVAATEMRQSAFPVQPYAWTIDGPNVALEAPADDAYPLILRMIQGFSLAGSTPSAAALYLLATYPDLYLYGSLLEASPFIRDDERVEMWQARFDRAFSEASNKEGRTRSMGTLAMDPALRHRGVSENYLMPWARFS